MVDASPPTTLDAAAILALDLDGVSLIEASAGTGKTHTIADLYLRQILGGRTPAQILLVTFTRAATEELRGRIRQRLYHAARVLGGKQTPAAGVMLLIYRQASDEELASLWLDRINYALATMDEASISTINGFCQRALRQYAVTSGQYFDSELIADDRELWKAAIKDWWRMTTYSLDPDTWSLVQATLPALPSLQKTLLELRSKPTVTLLPPGAEPIDVLLQQPQQIANELHGLAGLWFAARDEVADILTSTRVLINRKDHPYKMEQRLVLVQAADAFFNADSPTFPFANFEYLSAGQLHEDSTPAKRYKDPRFDHAFFLAMDRVAEAWGNFKARLRPALWVDAFRSASGTVAKSKNQAAVLAYQDQLINLLAALQSPDGAQLADALRAQYPVAMIDEFQDTDSIQFGIFRQIYLTDEPAGLTLIGDPKQAIYSFRGGDIFTYIEARRVPGVKLYQLDTNWRSSPGLVAAVNSLFSHRDAPFIYDDAIGYNPVKPNPDNHRLALEIDGQPAPPLTLWRLPQPNEEHFYNKEQMRQLIYRAIASEILALLQRDSRIDGRPVVHGDLAVLVRSAAEGQQLGQVLQQHGIPSVTISRESVFAADEARGLYELLRGINQFQDQAAARRALASSLLGYDYREIAAIVDDDPHWQAWCENLAELNQAWERRGFVTMFQRLLRRFDIANRLAEGKQRERRLTNLLQLAELLQQQSVALPGADPLLNWFVQQFEADAWEESEIRLEGDESLVKIVTIHKSKGLQYPVVFAPFLWHCTTVNRSRPTVFFHQADASACVDFGSADFEAHRRLAEKERLAEDLRLLYVALTRAHSRVYLAWGQAGGSYNTGYPHQTALAYLLHSRQSADELQETEINGFPENLDFDADLAALANGADGQIRIEPLPSAALPRAPGGETEPPTITLANFGRGRLPLWKIASFTGLTRGISHLPGQQSGEPLPAKTSAGDQAESDSILGFPAGSHVGLMLHSMLEHLDFTDDIASQCRALLPRFLPGVGLEPEQHGATLIHWFNQLLQTPLNATGLRLAALPERARLNELEFDFALDRFDADGLNRLLQSRVKPRLAPIQESSFEGLINGVIDLVFEHDGRYYLADYKSNRLGPGIEHYTQPCLEQAMLAHRYDLQSLLYVLALHRYLGGRLVDYDYRRHFGGSYYLFLRGMRPDLGPSHGIYFDRPDAGLIAALEQVFHFTPLEPEL